MKRLLITGAAGFIGYHLAQASAARGDFVVGLDNFNSYYSVVLKEMRAHNLKTSGVHIVRGEQLASVDALQSLLEQHQISHVVHLAAQAGVRYSLTHPEVYVQTNLVGFVNILEACRHAKVQALLFASSSSVYGNGPSPSSETQETNHPVSLYAATKKSNELLAHAYHHLFGIHTTALRFFTVYGPYGRPDMAYFSFSEAIMRGEPITLYERGTLLRDFTYIDDIVEGTLAAIDLSSPYDCFNLGNHRPESVNQLVQGLEEKLGKKAVIRYNPMHPSDVGATCADLAHSQAVLGYAPNVSLNDGLDRFVDWYLQEWYDR